MQEMFHTLFKQSLKSVVKQAQMPAVKFCPVFTGRVRLHTKEFF